MDKKSKITLALGITLLFALGAGIGTFAYFVFNGDNNDNVNGNTANIDIEYSTSEDISGVLIPTTNKEKGIVTTATAKLKDDSINTKFNMYITPTEVGDLATSSLKWEVVGTIDDEIVYTNNGNFENAEENTPIIIVEEYDLTKENTNFKINIWIDGTEYNEVAVNNTFTAVISADSLPLTSEF